MATHLLRRWLKSCKRLSKRVPCRTNIHAGSNSLRIYRRRRLAKSSVTNYGPRRERNRMTGKWKSRRMLGVLCLCLGVVVCWSLRWAFAQEGLSSSEEKRRAEAEAHRMTAEDFY